jgi:hypothetical protein
LAGSGNFAVPRDKATTGAPASTSAVTIPRPRPRLAPTTIVVVLDKSLMVSSGGVGVISKLLDPSFLANQSVKRWIRGLRRV